MNARSLLEKHGVNPDEVVRDGRTALELIQGYIDKSPNARIEEAEHYIPQVFSRNDDPDDAWLVTTRNVRPATAPTPLLHVYIQVFHTQVEKLSARHRLRPIDRDLRRPIFELVFDSPAKWHKWQERNQKHLLAFYCETIEVGDDTELVFGQWQAATLSILNKFVAWLQYMRAEGAKRVNLAVEHIKANYDRIVEETGGGRTMICIPGCDEPMDLRVVAKMPPLPIAETPAWCVSSVIVGNDMCHVSSHPVSPQDFKALVRGEKTLDSLGIKHLTEIPEGSECSNGMTFSEEAMRKWSENQHALESLDEGTATKQ